MIAILDYDAGNLKSVEKALSFLGEKSVITRDRREVAAADKVILPGVGSFGAAMEQLKKYEIDKMLEEARAEKKPILGICLGLQLLFDGSSESQGVEGLHLLSGDGRLFQGIKGSPYVYFVHSYYLKARDEEIVKAVTQYSANIHASVEKENIFACQFHPEKSSGVGLRILANFAKVQGGA